MHRILVGSGKGGVGKSTTAAALAMFCAGKQLCVGLLDADVSGPSLQVLFGQRGPVRVEMNMMVPILVNNLKCMSTGFLAPTDRAIVWSGAMLEGALWQMINQTHWGHLDVLIVDLPPGTNEIHIKIIEQLGEDASVVLVTSADPLSVADTIRAIDFFLEVQLPPAAAAVTPVGALAASAPAAVPGELPELSVGGYTVPTVMVPALAWPPAGMAGRADFSTHEGSSLVLSALRDALTALAGLCGLRLQT
jgi:hypothetical protein